MSSISLLTSHMSRVFASRELKAQVIRRSDYQCSICSMDIKQLYQFLKTLQRRYDDIRRLEHKFRRDEKTAREHGESYTVDPLQFAEHIGNITQQAEVLAKFPLLMKQDNKGFPFPRYLNAAVFEWIKHPSQGGRTETANMRLVCSHCFEKLKHEGRTIDAYRG